MQDTDQVKEQELTPEKPVKHKKKRYIIFSFINFIMLFIIPLCAVLVILFSLITTDRFYTGIIKNSNFLRVFIEAKNWEMNKKIQDEINDKVKLQDARKDNEEKKRIFENEKLKYEDACKISEYDSLKKQRKELNSKSYDDVKDTYPVKESFDQYRKKELARLDDQMEQIEKYRKENRKEINKTEDSMEEAEKNFKKASRVFEKKKDEAQDIVEKHKSGIGAKAFSDIELLEPRLNKILNERLIEGSVKKEIEKILEFLKTYDSQKAYGRVIAASAGQSMVKIPDLSISFWVDDDSTGIMQKRHLLSQVFVNEISNSNLVQHKELYTAMFRIFDSAFGEMIARSYMAKYGATINEGVITMQGVTLSGEQADNIILIMKIFTFGKFVVIALGGILFFYILMLIFSSAGSLRKLKALRRLFIYPSVFVIISSVAAFVFIRSYLEKSPTSPSDLMLTGLINSFSNMGTLYLFWPVVALFISLLIVGLIIGKIIHRKEKA